MPILDLQQRITERGRIRLGTKVDGTRRDGSTYTRPAKSRTFLISSHDRTVVETAAAEWADTAGEIEAFDAGFRVDTGRTELDVILPPEMMSFSQWREMWGNGYCARRCDGQRETISDGPCLCPADHEERRVLAAKGKACKDTTRLSVMLPDLPGFGLWRVESHGFYAATELAGAVQAVTHLAPNTLVRARLTAAAREVVRFDGDGNPKTHKFVVPTLDLPDVRLRELVAPDGGVGVQIQSPARQALTPVPQAALVETTGLSVAEQLSVTKETPRRKNAAAVLPPTGLRPGRESAGELASGQSVPESASPVSPVEGAAAAVAVPSSSAGGEEAQAEEVPPTGSQSPDGEPSPLPDGEGEGGVESLAHGDSPAPTATMLLAATGKSAGAAVMAVKRAAEAISAEGPYMAEEIAADPVFAAKVLAHLGGMPADGTTPTATYTKKQNGWIHAVWANHGGDNARKAFLSQLTSGRTDSSSELTAAEKKAYLDKTEELA